LRIIFSAKKVEKKLYKSFYYAIIANTALQAGKPAGRPACDHCFSFGGRFILSNDGFSSGNCCKHFIFDFHPSGKFFSRIKGETLHKE